jgi:hypothetical protein
MRSGPAAVLTKGNQYDSRVTGVMADGCTALQTGQARVWRMPKYIRSLCTPVTTNSAQDTH